MFRHGRENRGVVVVTCDNTTLQSLVLIKDVLVSGVLELQRRTRDRIARGTRTGGREGGNVIRGIFVLAALNRVLTTYMG
jgi:hypothetical protein